MKAVVVGGVAGGMSFAARARRLAEDAEIVVLERDPYVSYANCGLPYHLGGEISDRDALLLHTPQSLAKSLALDVRTGHEVLAIDPAGRTVAVRERATGQDYHETYDVLVLSTGAAPVIPPIPGAGLPAVRVLRTVPDADVLRAMVDGGARRAVIIGAGFIGLESAEALRHRGLAVTLVELAGQVMPALDPEMARSIELELLREGVAVRLGTSVTALREARSGTVAADLSDGSQVLADLVLLAAGVRPETSLAADAGLALGNRGALLVDEHLRTSVPSIYGVGDAIEVCDAVTGGPALVPLAGLASRQGRAAADHLFGRGGRRSPVLGTAIVRVFGTVAATTGPGEKALRAAGIPHHAVHLHPNNHAGYYPGARPLHLKLLFAPDGRVLGAQATGGNGVDKRIDVIATAIRAGLTVDDLADLELAYSPPFGSAKDPVNLAGMMASNLLAGTLALWRGDDLLRPDPQAVLLDVRSAAEFRPGHLPGALNIPHTELRQRLGEIPSDRPLLVYCASGFRSYLALRLLRQQGWPDVRSLSGGLSTLQLELPRLALEPGDPVAGLTPGRPVMASVTVSAGGAPGEEESQANFLHLYPMGYDEQAGSTTSLMTADRGQVMARVVILGAGISGHTAALHLRRLLGKGHEVVVVSPNSQWNWIPSNIWVGVGRMSPEEVTFPLAPVYRRQGIEFRQARAVAIWPGGDTASERSAVDIISTLPGHEGEQERLGYDYLINATGPKLNFAATPGLGPDGNSLSVCTPGHAVQAARALDGVIGKLRARQRQTLVIGVGHGMCTCEGAAFEYTFNVEHELRTRGLRDLAEVIYLSNEYELGDFGVGGMVFRQQGFLSSSQIWTESLFRERGVKAILRAHVERVEPGKIYYETLDGARDALSFDFAMLLPPFRGADLKAYDRAGGDITADLFAPSGFLKVDADYTPKPDGQWRAEDWPQTYQSPRYANIFGIGIAFAPPHPISTPRRSPDGTVISPAPPRTGMPSAVMGRQVARSIAGMIRYGTTKPAHTASMAAMGAACIASAGAGIRNGTAAAMTMYPVVPDYARFPVHGRSVKDTYGEIGLAAHWVKHLLHFVFIYKAKARPGWAFLPE